MSQFGVGPAAKNFWLLMKSSSSSSDASLGKFMSLLTFLVLALAGGELLLFLFEVVLSVLLATLTLGAFFPGQLLA